MSLANGGDAQGLDSRSIRKIALLSLVGASVEWFDFGLYGSAAALVFPALFFPHADPAVGVLLSFATLGVGFVARPLGGALWGHFGDRHGRKRAFLMALLTMAVGSVLIGLMPSYAAIGVAAPILLTVLRFVQGIAMGGQWGGATLLATESAPPRKRGFYGSSAQLGSPIGVLLATLAYFLLSLAMPPGAFVSWGWRVPFVLSIGLVGVAWYIHRRLEETPAFAHLRRLAAAAQDQGVVSRSPVLEVLRSAWRRVLLAGGAFCVVSTTVYIYTAFGQDYATRILHLSKTTALLAMVISLLAQVPVMLGAAAISDRIGRRKVCLVGAIGTAIWAFPLFWLVDTGTGWGMTLALLGGQFAVSLMYGPMAAFLAELFDARVRYSGASLSNQVGGLFGGTISALVAAGLYRAFGSNVPISLYIIAVSALAVACVLALPETYRNNLDDAEEHLSDVTRPGIRVGQPEDLAE